MDVGVLAELHVAVGRGEDILPRHAKNDGLVHARAKEGLSLYGDGARLAHACGELYRIAELHSIVEGRLNGIVIIGHAIALGVIRRCGHQQHAVHAGIDGRHIQRTGEGLRRGCGKRCRTQQSERRSGCGRARAACGNRHDIQAVNRVARCAVVSNLADGPTAHCSTAASARAAGNARVGDVAGGVDLQTVVPAGRCKAGKPDDIGA